MRMENRCFVVIASLLVALSVPCLTEAQNTGADRPRPAPYSPPWGLRPAAIGNVLRADTVVAFQEDAAGHDGETLVSLWLASRKFSDKFMGLARWGWVQDSSHGGASGNALVNTVLAGSYLLKPSPSTRLSLFLGLAFPTGQGGGDSPDPATTAARSAGVLARSAMDNAMFAVNDFVVFPGIDLAWVSDGWTVQGEATLLQLSRVRGEAAQPDSSKTNFTAGAHVGRFIGSHFSLGGELRYQRWLSTPTFVEANEDLRDNLSVALGPRIHVKLGKKTWFRPGVSYAVGLHGRIEERNYHIVQFDLPLSY